jgi:hypothetical protein
MSPQARWREANPLKRWAHLCLASALRRGLIERKPCAVCGEERVDAHHENYHEPMAVTWLCRLHHIRRHSELRASRDVF